MADALLPKRPKRRKPLPLRRIAFYMGIALIPLGYGFLSAPAETLVATASTRAFTGLGLIIGGAFLWLGAIFF